VITLSTFLHGPATPVCTVASRHYTQRPDLYPKLLVAAKLAAGAALNGPKTVEACQAYLLLGVYSPASKSFREDRAFLYYGLAVRFATDLEIHLPASTPHVARSSSRIATYTAHLSALSPSEEHERVVLSRTRIWLNCVCIDRSISTQLGKPSAIAISGSVVKAVPHGLEGWWRSSEFNAGQDFHLCAYADLLLVMSGFHDAVYSDAYGSDGAKKILDLNMVQLYANKITAVGEHWKRLVEEHFGQRGNPVLTMRDNLWPFLVSYGKLVVLSIGLRDGMRQGMKHNNPFADQCVDAASEILTQIVDKLAKLGYMRYCVEAYFVFMGFAAAFMLKILRPTFSFMMCPEREQKITQLVQRLIDLLGSDEVAIDNRHTPKLYSRFLADVLAKHQRAKAAKESDAGSGTSVIVNVNDNAINTVINTSSYASPLIPENPDTTLHPGVMDVTSNVFPSPLQQHTHSAEMDISSADTTPAPTHSSHTLSFPPALPTGQTFHYTLYNDSSPYMDVDRPLPLNDAMLRDADMMHASMVQLTDPAFWEHGAMPGFSWTTNPGAWPTAVDASFGDGEYDGYNPSLNANGSGDIPS